MALTFLQLRSNLYSAHRNMYPTAAPLSLEAQSQWINSAYQEVDRKLRWTRCKYSFTTVAAQSEYVVPVEVREVLGVEYVPVATSPSPYPLDEVSMDEYLHRQHRQQAAARVYWFMHHGDRYLLWPPPATAGDSVVLWIVSEPPDLVLDADTPGFPAHLHERIVDLALSYAMRHYGQLADELNVRAHILGELAQERLEPAVRRGGSRRFTTSKW